MAGATDESEEGIRTITAHRVLSEGKIRHSGTGQGAGAQRLVPCGERAGFYFPTTEYNIVPIVSIVE